MIGNPLLKPVKPHAARSPKEVFSWKNKALFKHDSERFFLQIKNEYM